MSLWVKFYSVIIQMKATEQYFPVVMFIMLCKVVLSFESVDKIVPQKFSLSGCLFSFPVFVKLCDFVINTHSISCFLCGLSDVIKVIYAWLHRQVFARVFEVKHVLSCCLETIDLQ